MSTKTINKLLIGGFILAGIVGLFLRFYHIDFGLPHSFYADEPEIAEPAIKYTYAFKDIVSNGNWYKLIPVSYVYGTFPAYLFTAATMLFSKGANVVNFAFSKADLYVWLRSINALVSFLVVAGGTWLAYLMFKNKFIALISFVLLSLNWKFIVHAHYLNQDIFLTLLLIGCFIFLYKFSSRELSAKTTVIPASARLFTILAGIFFGLAVGTKITALISVPLIFYVFMAKKEYRHLVVFSFIAFAAYIVTNPFSIIFADDFTFRIFQMLFKEGGLVFDSVDYGHFKYVFGLNAMLTAPILLFSIYGMYKTFKETKDKSFTIFLISNVLIYFVFYSIQSRRVDRWLLPILPILIVFSAQGIYSFCKKTNKILAAAILCVCLGVYLYYPTLLLSEFQRQTPKSAAYVWAQQNITIAKSTSQPSTLVYTEEGLDPFSKLPGSNTVKMVVYESENAQLIPPLDPRYFDYVVISSRPMDNFKRLPVVKKYPTWTQKWNTFENILGNPANFVQVKSFVLPTPNLIPLSNVYIYKNLKPIYLAPNAANPTL